MASRMLAQDKYGRGWRLARGCAGVVYNMSWYKLSGALLTGVRPIPFRRGTLARGFGWGVTRGGFG
jgi:hypothetical protein